MFRADPSALVICYSERMTRFTPRVFEYLPKWCSTYSAVWLLHGWWPGETAAVSAHVLFTPCNTAPVYSVI